MSTSPRPYRPHRRHDNELAVGAPVEPGDLCFAHNLLISRQPFPVPRADVVHGAVRLGDDCCIGGRNRQKTGKKWLDSLHDGVLTVRARDDCVNIPTQLFYSIQWILHNLIHFPTFS